MSTVNYNDSKYPVRADFAESHTRFWQRLASPGNCLSAKQRIAVAKEVRQAFSCELCRQRKVALSPYQVNGEHDQTGELSSVMVEVVHRVITDSGRLTKTWFDSVIADGLKHEEYVEILGTVVHVFSIDEFSRALGLPLRELPEAGAGEPSHYRPGNLVEDVAWLPMLDQVIDSGPESDLWEGKLEGNVIRALSLVPDEVRSLQDLLKTHYLDEAEFGDFEKSPQGTLSRIQTEVVAARVSAFNDCFY
ncbi:MAG: hypothetical protein GKR93_19075 [Gammaproteobacteria bacterium]|nr:hypothetical protein [Gammaproteobacteria bacterium]